ncbi:MAG: thiamine pyrophosphate-dependent enzyme [Vampirovibrionales bacterium]|nr:thiamine pyrophosphate-dependent enzyme [Vampirovibrionales bacterium]
MSKLAEVQYENYLRMNKMPTLWCSGCGDGVIMKSLIRAMDSMQIERDNFSVVAGIGCSGRMSSYMDFNTVHTTHGRALAFATGLKMAAPNSKIVVITGDGDCLAIGGNHFLHACRRNIDLTVILVNNFTYGLTGGQVSPETPSGSNTPTTPYGNSEPNFDTSNLAIAAGATYVARALVASPVQMDKVIKGAIEHNGFSVVEVLSNCHINWGRKNDHPDPFELVQWLKNDVSTFSKNEAEKSGKRLIGVLHHDKERPEYASSYYNNVVYPAADRAKIKA